VKPSQSALWILAALSVTANVGMGYAVRRAAIPIEDVGYLKPGQELPISSELRSNIGIAKDGFTVLYLHCADCPWAESDLAVLKSARSATKAKIIALRINPDPASVPSPEPDGLITLNVPLKLVAEARLISIPSTLVVDQNWTVSKLWAGPLGPRNKLDLLAYLETLK